MKKLKIIVIFVSSLIFLTICCKDESNPTGSGTDISSYTISGQIEGWTGGSDKTIGAVYGDPGTSNYSWLPSSPISADGKFTVKLGTPPDSLLEPIPSGLNVSDPSAKVGAKLEMFVIRPNGGELSRESSTTSTFFAYSDKNVNITGSDEGNTINLNFVKGWNRYTVPKSGSGLISNSEPADTRWVYYP